MNQKRKFHEESAGLDPRYSYAADRRASSLPDKQDVNRGRFHHDHIGRKAADALQPYSGCANPNNEDLKVKKGNSTMVCIIISSAGSWVGGMPYRRFTFTPLADEANYFVIDNSYYDLVEQSNFPDATVHVESQKEISFMRRYYNATMDQIFPFLTAIINVDEGDVIGITWDEACIFCKENQDPDRCVENTYSFDGTHPTGDEFPTPSKGCWLNKEECDTTTTSTGKDEKLESVCTLGIHFVWTGTDENNVPLTSYGTRRSALLKNPVYPPNFDDLEDMWPQECTGKFCGKD